MVRSRTDRPRTATCEFCGREFPADPRGVFPRYCSQRCRTAANKARRIAGVDGPSAQTLTCGHCGKPFRWMPSRTRTEPPTYCTPLCASRAYIDAHHDSVLASRRNYYQAHRVEILSRHASARGGPKPPRPERTQEERAQLRREYNREYQRRRRAAAKERRTT